MDQAIQPRPVYEAILVDHFEGTSSPLYSYEPIHFVRLDTPFIGGRLVAAVTIYPTKSSENILTADTKIFPYPRFNELSKLLDGQVDGYDWNEYFQEWEYTFRSEPLYKDDPTFTPPLREGRVRESEIVPHAENEWDHPTKQGRSVTPNPAA